MKSKFNELLNKNIKRTFVPGTYEYDLYMKYNKEWENRGQKIKIKNELDYMYASAIFQSIHNKMTIENDYVLVRNSLEMLWTALDYTERKRLVNVDMKKTYDSLPCFMSRKDGTDIYVAFLDERLNEVYKNETILFDLKQYHDLFIHYENVIEDYHRYDIDFFDGKFTHTQCIIHEGNYLMLFNYTLSKFYVISNGDINEYPLFDENAKKKTLTNEIIMPLAELLREYKETEFFTLAKNFGLYSEEFYKNINRKLEKKSIFNRW